LKHFLAFPMFATVAWLVWVFGQQLDIDAVLSLLLSLIAIGFAAWIYGQWQHLALRNGVVSTKAILLLCAALIATASALALVANAARDSVSTTTAPASKSSGWEVWSQQRVDELLAQGKPVFVDFTAAWCVSCQVNKKAVLEGDTVRKFLLTKRLLCFAPIGLSAMRTLQKSLFATSVVASRCIKSGFQLLGKNQQYCFLSF
jgi:thiol:disulfide interchange protein